MSALAASRARSSAPRVRGPLLRLRSDERLVALVRRGDDAAFPVLLARYRPRLLAFCRGMLGSSHDAEDVVQEVALAAYRAMLADERPIDLRPWLYRIARNESVTHLRRRPPAGEPGSLDHQLADQGRTSAEQADLRDGFRRLVGDIAHLQERQRTALLLRELEGLAYEEIAAAMQATVPAVKSLLVRARMTLAELAEERALEDRPATGGRRHSPARRTLTGAEPASSAAARRAKPR